MYEAIDGRRAIGQIVGTVQGSGLRARRFFQKLGWYDQVVFDPSKGFASKVGIALGSGQYRER